MDQSQSVRMPGATVARAEFVANTYIHLLGAILAFIVIELGLFATTIPAQMYGMIAGNRYGWLMILGGFMLVSWFATRAAHTATSKGAQYAALGSFVLAEALIFAPLLLIANSAAPGAIKSAGFITALGFIGLTGIAWTTRKDFSFLRGILMWGGAGALLVIIGGALFGFNLGTWFSVGMVVFAGAAILYDTSNVIRHYPEDRFVAAALQLFGSVALMFWYVLQLLMASRR